VGISWGVRKKIIKRKGIKLRRRRPVPVNARKITPGNSKKVALRVSQNVLKKRGGLLILVETDRGEGRIYKGAEGGRIGFVRHTQTTSLILGPREDRT